MKKLMSFFLIFVLIFTTVVPVFAADPAKAKVELKQAIEIAKEKLNINTEGYNFNSSYSEDQEGRKNWYLNWEAKKGKIGSISASVDAETGDITNFNSYSATNNYSKIPKYSREQALKAASEFAMKMQPDLIYADYNEAPKAILAYTFKNGSKPIDAITGEVVNYSNYYPEYGMSGRNALNSKTQDSALTPEEDKNVEDTSKLISKEKAMEVVSQYMKIDSKDINTSSNLNAGYPKGSNPVWYFSWEYRSKDGAEYNYKGGMVDAVTGELKGFNQNGTETDFNKNDKPKYSKEDTKAIAESFLKKAQPEKFAVAISRDLLNTYESEMFKSPNYGFNYIKKIDDITYPFDILNVNVSSYTGEITNYNMDWYEPALPKVEKVISLDEAYENFFDKQNFSLKYVKYSDYTKEAQAKSEIKLVFAMDNTSNMQLLQRD